MRTTTALHLHCIPTWLMKHRTYFPQPRGFNIRLSIPGSEFPLFDYGRHSWLCSVTMLCAFRL